MPKSVPNPLNPPYMLCYTLPLYEGLESLNVVKKKIRMRSWFNHRAIATFIEVLAFLY